MMAIKSLAIAVTMIAASAMGHADAFLPHPGSDFNVPAYSYFASQSGNISGVLVRATANAYGDEVRLVDVTSGVSGAWQRSNDFAVGETVKFLSGVEQGDRVRLEGMNLFPYDVEHGFIFTSDAALSSDGANHWKNYGAGVVGLEDLRQGFDFSDSNFSDTVYKIDGLTSVAQTPEPSSLAMLGTGLLGACSVLRRKTSVVRRKFVIRAGVAQGYTHRDTRA